MGSKIQVIRRRKCNNYSGCKEVNTDEEVGRDVLFNDKVVRNIFKGSINFKLITFSLKIHN